MLDTMRRLYPRGPANRGICVDADGATLGADCVLVHRTRSSFRPIERGDASQIQKCVLAPDRDRDWLFRQCQRIADALNSGEVALAQIHGLYIPIGELDDRQLRRLAGIRFAKAGFDPNQPRLPKGDPHGGEWTTGDGAAPSHPAHRLVPGHVAAPAGGDIHPMLLAQLTIPEPAGAPSAGGDTQPPPLAQRTTIEATDTSPTGAAISGISESRAPDRFPLRNEMMSPSTTPIAGPTENAGTPAIGGGDAAASLYAPGRDAIKPSDSIEELLFTALPIGGLFLGTGSRLLARALEKVGITRALGYVCHHIVALEDMRAEVAQAVLDGFKIDLNDAINGVFLRQEAHERLHNKQYYDAVNDALVSAGTRAKAEEILEAIGRALEAGVFPGMFP
jgi:hypothetical protein